MDDLSLILALVLIVGFVCGLILMLILKRTKTLGKFGALTIAYSILGPALIVIGTIVISWSYVIVGAFVFLCFVPDTLIRHITLKVFRWLSLLAVAILGYLVLSNMLLRVGVLLLGFLVGTAGLVDAFRLKTGKIPSNA
ncbi:MAG: hypothetical protein ACFFER_15600 [Candidatus Thorarchaeota archaeon]